MIAGFLYTNRCTATFRLFFQNSKNLPPYRMRNTILLCRSMPDPSSTMQQHKLLVRVYMLKLRQLTGAVLHKIFIKR